MRFAHAQKTQDGFSKTFTEVLANSERNSMIIGRRVEVYYADRGWCSGFINNFEVAFGHSDPDGTTVVTVGPEDPYRFALNMTV